MGCSIEPMPPSLTNALMPPLPLPQQPAEVAVVSVDSVELPYDLLWVEELFSMQVNYKSYLDAL